MDYPLTWKAFNQFAESYEDFGEAPDEVVELVKSAAKSIKELVDRPDAEKDEMIATVALMFSSDVAIYKELPPNIDEYTPSIKKNIETALAALDSKTPYAATGDMKQVGLALVIAMAPMLTEQLETIRDGIQDLDDPHAIKVMKKAIGEIVEKQKVTDAAAYFTGEQPRLEAEAKKHIDVMTGLIGELSETVNNLKPAEPPARQPRVYSPPPPPP